MISDAAPPPRPLTTDDVHALMIDLVAKLPPEIMLKDMLAELIDSIVAVSDRITMRETANLIGVAAVMAKVCAAKDYYATTPITVGKDTCQ